MTGEHLTAEMLRRYFARTMEPASILALHSHLAQCTDCARMLSESAEARARSESHITEQEAVEYAAGASRPDRISEHISECAVCGALVEDLRAFGSGEAQAPRKRQRYLAVAIAAALILAVAGGSYYALKPRPAEGENALLRDSMGPVTMTSAIPEYELVRASLRSGRLPEGPPSFAVAADPVRAAATAAAAISVKTPSGIRVAADRPVFEWSGCTGGEYSVQIFDEDFNEVGHSPRVTATVWEASAALPRGLRYLWQVKGKCGGRMVSAPAPPAPPARFEVAPEAAVRRIEAARPSHLALAVVYAAEGFGDQARAELDILDGMNPGSPLLASLRASLR
jgi:hypothetical protein